MDCKIGVRPWKIQFLEDLGAVVLMWVGPKIAFACECGFNCITMGLVRLSLLPTSCVTQT